MFQRGSVIVTDLFLSYVTWKLVDNLSSRSNKLSDINRYSMTICNVGLLLVDHIHFQYNGILLGLLLLSIYFCNTKSTVGITAVFSLLVLMKHLFAPLVLVFIAVIFSIIRTKNTQSMILELIKVGFVAIMALLFAFGPFIFSGGMVQLDKIFSRLFPFSRGLVHAYWAPNIWAFYCFLDKVLIFICRKILKITVNINVAENHYNSSSGRVGNFAFAYLPQVEAHHCLILVLFFISIFSFQLNRRKNLTTKDIIRCLVLSSMTSFMFGYHVHEKAILIPWLLQTLIATESQNDRLVYSLLTLTGSFSLFPLLPGTMEWFIKGNVVLCL
jgi:alpha-1,3-glucosyltransferase